MKTMNKPVIVIDLGGAYFTHGSKIAIKKIPKKFRVPEKHVIEALRGSYAKKYYAGKIDSNKFWKHVARYLNVSQEKLKEIKKFWFDSYKPQKGMKQLVRKLKRKYRIVVLSGNIKDRVQFLNKKYNLDKEFHEQHYSFHYGINKPDVRLFNRFIKKTRLDLKDCIVIDDLGDFLAAVRKAGAKTVLFKNAKQLEKNLRKFGVEI